jgi:hypothetical protein
MLPQRGDEPKRGAGDVERILVVISKEDVNAGVAIPQLAWGEFVRGGR